MAAPALAASAADIAGCLSLRWTNAVFTQARDVTTAGWYLVIEPATNTCSAPVMVETVEVWTTYHPPAVTAAAGPQRVATYRPSCTLGGGEPWLDSCVVGADPWPVPPVDEEGTSLLPAYYGSWNPGGDCVPVDEDTDLSCDVGACDRLAADGTYLLVTYRQADGALVTVTLETFASC